LLPKQAYDDSEVEESSADIGRGGSYSNIGAFKGSKRQQAIAASKVESSNGHRRLVRNSNGQKQQNDSLMNRRMSGYSRPSYMENSDDSDSEFDFEQANKLHVAPMRPLMATRNDQSRSIIS